MTSILTNVAAMAALQTLRAIGSNMEETQSRVSSGMRVKTASDNAAYWSIATTMRSDNGALSAVQDALGLGAAKVDTAYSAMETTVDVVKEISKKLVAAREAGVDKAKIQEEIRQLQDQLKSIGRSASFSGENWLKGKISDASGNLTPITKQVVGSFIRDGAGNVAVKTINIQVDNKTALFDTTTGATKTAFSTAPPITPIPALFAISRSRQRRPQVSPQQHPIPQRCLPKRSFSVSPRARQPRFPPQTR